MLHIPSWHRIIWHILERFAMVDEFRVLHVWLSFQIHLSVRVTCIVRQTVVDRASDTGRKAGVEVFFYVKIAYAVRIGILDTQRKIFESIFFSFLHLFFCFSQNFIFCQSQIFCQEIDQKLTCRSHNPCNQLAVVQRVIKLSYAKMRWFNT